MLLRHSLVGMLLMASVMALGAGCQSSGGAMEERGENTKELIVYVTNNAATLREKALSYGLKVKTIDSRSASSQLIQALLNSPTDKYFAVVNPALKRYINGGAVSDQVKPEDIDNLFRQLKMVSKAGAQQFDRLSPQTQGNSRLVVFSDFECPYCKKMDEVVEQWKTEFGDKLEVEYINFPLPFHEHAFAAAEAAECARAQDKFEPYKEQLFANQESLREGTFVQISRNLKMDSKAFSQCLVLHQQRKIVRQDQYFGQYMGLSGTPTLVLNGEVLMGMPVEGMKERIQSAIENPVAVTSAGKKEHTEN